MRRDTEQHKKKVQPKSSHIESCSYVAYFFTIPFGIAYIFWIITPNDIMEQINVEYYPSKMLACLVPAIIIVVFVFTPLVYTILNERSMPRSSSTSHLSDEYANCDRYRMQRNLRNSRGIPDVQDVDVSLINDFHARIFPGHI